MKKLKSKQLVLPMIAVISVVLLGCSSNEHLHSESLNSQEKIKDAVVQVIANRIGTDSTNLLCSGIVIKLKKGMYECKNPILVTAGHCLNKLDKITVMNDKGARFHVPGSEIQALRKKCLDAKELDCLVTPEDVDSLVFDQALIPIYNEIEEVKPYEIDINEVLSQEELEPCFEDPNLTARMTSAIRVTPEKISKLGITSKTNIDNSSIQIYTQTCTNLKWYEKLKYIRTEYKKLVSQNLEPEIINEEKVYEDYTEGIYRNLLEHKCISIKGLSGSFITLDCNNKKGFFINVGRVVYKEQTTSSPRSPHKVAYHVDSKLLEFYFENYCSSDAYY